MKKLGILSLCVLMFACAAVRGGEKLLNRPMQFRVCFSESMDTVFGKFVEKSFAEITEKTNGELVFDLFPDNQLGSIPDMLEQMRAGAPLICSMGFDNLGDIVPDFAPAAFPYIFQSLEEVQLLGKSDWIAGISQKLTAASIAPLCFGAQGYRHFISTKKITDASSIAGLKVRMGPSGAAQGFIRVMGGAPTTSTWADNYSLLQTGVFDACEAPLSLLYSSSLYEVCDYLCLSGHFVNPLVLCMNPMFWDQIPEPYQKVVLDTLYEGCAWMAAEAGRLEADYIKMFQDKGVTVTDPDKSTFAKYVPDLFKLLNLAPSIYDDIRAGIESQK